MAYIPPHKRHLKDKEMASPVPAILNSKFEKKKNQGSRSNSKHGWQGGKIIFAKHCISKWWALGLTDENQFPASVRLELISAESIERERGDKSLVLVGGNPSKEDNEITQSFDKSPWLSIVEKIQPDLLTSFQNVRNELELYKSEVNKPYFVARFGKVLFHGETSITLDMLSESLATELTKNQLNKSFYTNVPDAYMEAIQRVVVPKIGIDYDGEKEYYYLKVYDKSRPDVTISCKCTIRKDREELELHKIELNAVRHLVVDISCLDKDLDLRLMLETMKILTEPTEEEEHGIRELMKSAIIDPDVKGGLRWPLGKESFGDRFCMVGVWHVKYKVFESQTMRLKLRHADRFDFRTSKGRVSREVILKLVGISRQLMEGMVETGAAAEMLQETLQLIWAHFLSFKGHFF